MSFDRVASIYDATRALPPGVPERVADRIVAAAGAGAGTQFLELGVGTGRIGLPLIQRGYPYIGMDVSREMLDRLRAKVPDANNLTLIEGDIARLPLPDASVDVVLVVHVLHLVSVWRRAIDEAERVLRPGGLFIEGHNWTPPGRYSDDIRRQWRALIEDAGVELRPPYGSWQAIEEEMIGRGHRASLYRVAGWDQSFVPMDIIEGYRNRDYSETWPVPDDVLLTCHERMLQWAADHFDDPTQQLSAPSEFVLAVYSISGVGENVYRDVPGAVNS